MPIRIYKVSIENCGTGIKLEGDVDADISGASFRNNHKDIEMVVADTSHINIEHIDSLNCRTDSITVKVYSKKIEAIKRFVEAKSNLFSEMQIKQIKKLLDELDEAKDNHNRIKTILKQFYQVGQGTAIGLLVEYIKQKFNWK